MMSKPTYEELEQKVKEIEQKLDKFHNAERANPGSNDIRRLLDLAPYGLFLIDLTGKIIAANRSGAEQRKKSKGRFRAAVRPSCWLMMKGYCRTLAGRCSKDSAIPCS
jgi:hypothetical protein